MKATITSVGALVITPESELEAYALTRWSDANLADWFTASDRGLNVEIDCSAFPVAPIVISRRPAR